MRVLHVTGAYPSPENPQPGAFIRSQVESLRARGVEVDVCVLEGSGVEKYLRGVGQVRRMVARGDYDLVHAHYMYAGWTARLATTLPLVVSFMGNDVLGNCDGEGRYPATSVLTHGGLSKLLAAVSARGVVKSRELGERLRPFTGRLTQLANGVDLAVFSPRPQDRRDATRAALGLEPGDFAILFSGRPEDPVKRWALAERALAELRRAVPRAKLLAISGRTPDQVAEVLSAVDCLLVTSAHEGSPNAVKEALACELPIVSVDVGDVKARVDGLEGCHVVGATPEALAAALAAVAARGERLEGGRARAPSLEDVAGRLVALYEEILPRRG